MMKLVDFANSAEYHGKQIMGLELGLMRYVLLLRGVNVGGKNRVVMPEMVEKLRALGLRDVASYINSGNLFFSTAEDEAAVRIRITAMLAEEYPFVACFALISAARFLADAQQLPSWWNEPMARKDVLFHTGAVDVPAMRETIRGMRMGNERVHFGENAVFWGKGSMADYSRTAYAREVIRQPFYRQVTIRNGHTFGKIAELLNEEDHTL